MGPQGSKRAARTESIVTQGKILKRFVQAYSSPETKKIIGPVATELRGMLYQCLDAWKGEKWSSEVCPAAEAHETFCLVDDLAQSSQDKRLRPDDKAYSMCLTVIAIQAPNLDGVRSLGYCTDLWERRRGLDCEPDLLFYNALLYALAKTSTPSSAETPMIAEQVFDECSRHHSPDGRCFVSLMLAFANQGNIESMERVQAILEYLLSAEETLTLVTPETFNVCIDGWAKLDYPDKAEALLFQMYQLGKRRPELKPTIVSFNAAINGWAKTKRVGGPQQAEALLWRMEQLGCPPTLESFAAVLDAWSRTSQPGSRVEGLLDRLEAMSLRNPSSPSPNKFCYVIAIRAWAATSGQQDAPLRAEALVSRMQQLSSLGDRKELKPTEIVNSALLEAWSKSTHPKAPERSKEVFREILADPSAKALDVSLNAFLRSLASCGRSQEAYELLLEMEQHHPMLLDQSSYDLVMQAFANSRERGAADNAVVVLRKLQSAPVSTAAATPKSCALALVAMGNSSEPDAAERAQSMFFEMLKLGKDAYDLRPNIIVANCVLRAWAKCREGGAAEKAENFFNWIQKNGPEHDLCPDGTSYTHMIRAWAHSGQRIGPQRAERYLELLKNYSMSKETEFKLKTSHYNLVAMAWARSKEPKGRRRLACLVEEMLHLGELGYSVQPDTATLRFIDNAMSNDPSWQKDGSKLRRKITSAKTI